MRAPTLDAPHRRKYFLASAAIECGVVLLRRNFRCGRDASGRCVDEFLFREMISLISLMAHKCGAAAQHLHADAGVI